MPLLPEGTKVGRDPWIQMEYERHLNLRRVDPGPKVLRLPLLEAGVLELLGIG